MSAANKTLQFTPLGRWYAHTQAGFAIMSYVPAPVIWKLCSQWIKPIIVC